MKKLLIALGILLMLTGATVGTLKVMKIGPFAEDGAEEDAASSEEAPPEKTGFMSRNTPVFYPLDPLIVPIFDDNKVVATIQIHVKLEVVGKDNMEKVSRLRPRISDALLRDLYGFLPRLIKSRNHVDVAILKQRLKIMTDRAIGEGIVQDVLIQSISDQAN